jgi:hypothetical protein
MKGLLIIGGENARSLFQPYKKIFIFFITICAITAVVSSAYAAWSIDSSINTPICTAPSDQNVPRVVSDSAGGAIISWNDHRNDDGDLYAQRVDVNGNILWALNGVPISTAPGAQYLHEMVSDGNGGAIFAWYDTRNNVPSNPNLYAQRVDANGVVQWAANGILIRAADDMYLSLKIVSDGNGGAIIIWDERRNGTIMLYAQRIDATGKMLWQNGGVPVSIMVGSNSFIPDATSDGFGGAIVTWTDFRNDAYNPDIYAQRIDANGKVLWTANGVPVCTSGGIQDQPRIVNDGSGGAIVVWHYYHNWINTLHAQRVDANGNLTWPTAGIAVATLINSQVMTDLMSDGSGGAIITWFDSTGSQFDVYAQRINGSGQLQWTAAGLAITNTKTSWVSRVTTDGSGGAIITWQDSRNGSDADIFAQRVNASGQMLWRTNGVPIATSSIFQDSPILVSDNSGGAIIAWEQNCSPSCDLYAQRVSPGVFPLANISASPTQLDFGSITVGGHSSAQIVTLTETTGVSALSLGALSITGTNASEFAKVSDNCSSGSLLLTNCMVQILFSPTSSGPKSANLIIPSNDANSPTLSITLLGTGDNAPVPHIAVAPTSITFSGITAGHLSLPQIITVTNSGTAPLSIESISLQGTDVSQFMIADSNCSNSTLAPSGSCFLEAVFSPTAQGSKTASISIFSSDPDTREFKVSLAGSTTASTGIAVAVSNATLGGVTITDTATGGPANYTPQAVVSFSATSVTGPVGVTISRFSTPKDLVIYKLVNGEWKQLYPSNTCRGISNIAVSGSSLTFTITDNGDCDSDPNVGAIYDPVAIGQSSGTGANGGGSGGCFIATAAYGSYLNPHVSALRNFRDKYLMTNGPGRSFVTLYYRYSPPMADYITQHEALRLIVRLALTPIIFTIQYPIFVSIILLLIVTGRVLWRQSTHKHHLS